MDCNDDRARRLLPSFDGLQDDDEEYLESHLAKCFICSQRREKFRRLDRLVRQLLADVSQGHIDSAKLDQYVQGSGGLSTAEEQEIKLHLELCSECQKVRELLSKCNEEIASGLWDSAVLTKSDEATFHRISQENRDRLREFFPVAEESPKATGGSYARATFWLRRLKEPRRFISAVCALIAAASITIYVLNRANMGRNQPRSSGSEIRLVSPGRDEALAKPYVFRWEPAASVVSYEITIKDIERPEEPVIRASNLLEASYQLTDSDALKLGPGRLYQWEVSGVTGSRRKITSPIWIFRAAAG